MKACQTYSYYTRGIRDNGKIMVAQGWEREGPGMRIVLLPLYCLLHVAVKSIGRCQTFCLEASILHPPYKVLVKWKGMMFPFSTK